MILTDEDAQWLCGFWEGDGGMHYTGSIIFYQKDRRVLEYIKDLLGTNQLVKYKSVGSGSQLYLLKAESLYILKNHFGKYLVSAGRQEQVARNTRLWLDQHEPTISWIVGFWEAEGHFCLRGRHLKANVSQKDTRVLEKIQKVVGGHVEGVSLSLRKKEIEAFLPEYLKYSRNPEKQEQLEACRSPEGVEKALVKAQEHYMDHKEEIVAYNQEHKVEHAARDKTRNQEHKEEAAARQKAYHQRQRELIALCLQWQKENSVI